MTLSRIRTILEVEAKHLPDTAKADVVRWVEDVATEYQVDPLLILAVIKVESQFRFNSHSSSGAIGLMQLMPNTAKVVAAETGLREQNLKGVLANPELNLRFGVHYLNSLISRFHGDLWKALMAYNQGPTSVFHRYGHRPVPAHGYQAKVMRTYLRFSNG